MQSPAPKSEPTRALSFSAWWARNLTEEDARLLGRGLNAQSRMLPHALIYFALGLPLYLYALISMSAPVVLGASIVLFAVNWGLFYAFNSDLDALRKGAESQPDQYPHLVPRLFWRQGLCAGLWVICLNIVSLMAIPAGANAQLFLFVCMGAAIGIIFFTSPVLMFLLTLGPLAAVGPLIAIWFLPASSEEARHLIMAALALSLALGFMLNRHFVEHYKLEDSQIRLMEERQSALEATEALSESKMSLIETLSREVLTGLNGLEHSLKRANLLLPRAPGPRAHIESALNEARHLQSIIVTTLDNDTATSGGLDLEISPLNLASLLKDLREDYEPLAMAKGLEFSLDLSPMPDQGAAIGDLARVKQIVSHLLSNAIAYTPKGRVELILVGVSDGQARIQVVDSGQGLQPEEIDRAFKPYQRILRTSSGMPGAGLGLSLSRALSALMGAKLNAESTPDVGSKFWLDLPFDPDATLPVEPEPDTDDASEARLDDMRGLKVLLIANDSLKAAQIRSELEQSGHACLTATTPARALSLAGKVELDACVMANEPIGNLDEPEERAQLERFVAAMRHTQRQANLHLVALLPEGGQAEQLLSLGIDPLLWPLSNDGLNRALSNTARAVHPA